jgi:hypothetical protein
MSLSAAITVLYWRSGYEVGRNAFALDLFGEVAKRIARTRHRSYERRYDMQGACRW